ncbi:MAG: hypothetical protein AAGA31_14215 [Bacteroidota bacterium]
MEPILTKLRLFFGLSDDTTEAEVNAKLSEELKTKMAAEQSEETATEEGANAGAKSGEETASEKEEDTTTEKADDKKEDKADDAKDDATAKALAAINATLTSINSRLEKVESTEAAEETGGQKETADAEDDKRIYRQNPINQKAAKLFPAKKRQ